ncbi:hypothetical protein SLA2020_411750 [Shorea laevis]
MGLGFKKLIFSKFILFRGTKRKPSLLGLVKYLEGRDIVQLSARWNVSNGQNILIYEDNSIPTLPEYKVISPPIVTSLFSHVCELLDSVGQWDVNKLNACFSNEECREILKIPTGDCADSLIWHFDKYGRFSVKSAYLLALNAVNEPDMHTDTMVLSSGEWKNLWKQKVPPKIHVFLWRAIHNSLPSLDTFFR